MNKDMNPRDTTKEFFVEVAFLPKESLEVHHDRIVGIHRLDILFVRGRWVKMHPSTCRKQDTFYFWINQGEHLKQTLCTKQCFGSIFLEHYFFHLYTKEK
jgi:hypothetical protein